MFGGVKIKINIISLQPLTCLAVLWATLLNFVFAACFGHVVRHTAGDASILRIEVCMHQHSNGGALPSGGKLSTSAFGALNMDTI